MQRVLRIRAFALQMVPLLAAATITACAPRFAAFAFIIAGLLVLVGAALCVRDGVTLASKVGAVTCVLYPVGSHWADAKVLMYAKIASPTYPKAEEFARWAIGEFQKEGDGFNHKRIKEGKTPEGYPYFINEYRREKGYSRIERVAYVQLPEAVAYIVFSAEGEELYRKHSSALTETVKSLTYMPRFIGYHE